MKVKKLLAIAASAVMMLAVFTACTGNSSNSSNASGSKEAITLKFAYWDNPDTSEDMMTKLYGEGIKDFNSSIGADNALTIEYLYIASNDYGAKISAMGAAGNLPDTMMQQPGTKTKDYAAAGYLTAMNDYLNADSAWKSSFQAGMADQLTFDGKQWAIPIQFAASCMFFNTELFTQAGVNADDIKTWDNFITACDTLKSKGITPLAMGCKDGWTVSLFTGQIVQRLVGTDIFYNIRDLKADSTFSTDVFYKAGDMTMDLINKGYVQDSYAGDGADQQYAVIKAGEAAMLCQGSWAIGSLNADDSTVKGKMGVFPFPSVAGGTGDTGKWMGKTDNIAISRDCKDKDRALLWVKYLSSPTFQKWTGEKAGKMPTTNVTIDLTVAPPEFGYVQKALTATGTGIYPFIDEMLGYTFGTEWNNCLTAFTSGAKTVKAAFDDLQVYNESMKASGGKVSSAS